MPENVPKNKNSARLWLKRLGIAGFLFFLIKGLIWLVLLIAAAYFGGNFLK